jgi:hypothetical protein
MHVFKNAFFRDGFYAFFLCLIFWVYAGFPSKEMALADYVESKIPMNLM